MFLEKGVKQSANFAYCLNFLNGLVYLLSILPTKHEADFQLHLYNLPCDLELLKGPRCNVHASVCSRKERLKVNSQKHTYSSNKKDLLSGSVRS